MFARRVAGLLLDHGEARPVSKAWLDQFFMRSFTGHSAFDHVLPVCDGVIEAGFDVDASLARKSLEHWLRGRRMISASAELVLREPA